ncbi:DUF2293 domain-containing protein [Breoghania sp. L-A4]|uniref:DUF2293 domain-containing protein n=1 Tax=Breoghania sp. L-A4 TaxID=2304600 RepID=UPI000E35829F|nr:DUF2293 domain-containing protein [Breoghania sp. L-A4]AXS41374.1 DUF2293 domain-containing protein [Breoghania sp. L-A4]
MSGGTKRQRDMRKALRALVPLVPYDEAECILEQALAGHLRHLPPSIAVWLAATSRIRHAHTDYDDLLGDGYDRDAARFFTCDAINGVLTTWGSARQIGETEEIEE